MGIPIVDNSAAVGLKNEDRCQEHSRRRHIPKQKSHESGLYVLVYQAMQGRQVLTGEASFSSGAREWGLPPVALNKPRSREENV